MKCSGKEEKEILEGVEENKEAFKTRECGRVVAIESNKVEGKIPN